MNNVVLISLTQEELRNIIRDVVREELKHKGQKELLNQQEVCELLGCSVSAINKWKSENRIPYKKLGKRVFYPRTEVLAAMKESNYYKLREIM